MLDPLVERYDESYTLAGQTETIQGKKVKAIMTFVWDILSKNTEISPDITDHADI